MKISAIPKSISALPRKQLVLIGSGFVVIMAGILLLVLMRPSSISFDTYTSNQGGFTVQVPGGQMIMVRDRVTFMEKQVNQFTYQTETPDGCVFSIVHFDLPPGVITPSERTTIVNQLINDFIDPIQGLLESSSETTIQSNEAVKFTATGMVSDEEQMADAVVILVSNRVYVIGFMGEKGRVSRKMAHTFLSSFAFSF